MEKLIYLLWPDPSKDAWSLAKSLRQQLVPQLLATATRAVRLNVRDEDVYGAAPLLSEQVLDPQPSAVLQIWVDSSIRQWVAPIEENIAQYVQAFRGYVVSESCPLPNRRHVVPFGMRTPGFSHISLLRCPPDMRRRDWVEHWLNVQTNVTMQSTNVFEYRQNYIVRPLGANEPGIDGFAELCFESEAMQDLNAYFAAPDDGLTSRERLVRMLDSYTQFCRPGTTDSFATSQYIYRDFGLR